MQPAIWILKEFLFFLSQHSPDCGSCCNPWVARSQSEVKRNTALLAWEPSCARAASRLQRQSEGLTSDNGESGDRKSVSECVCVWVSRACAAVQAQAFTGGREVTEKRVTKRKKQSRMEWLRLDGLEREGCGVRGAGAQPQGTSGGPW